MNTLLLQRDMVCCIFNFLEQYDIYNFTFINKFIHESVYKKKYFKNFKLKYFTSGNVDFEMVPFKITYLTFGDEFNQMEFNLPSSITHLTFGDKFNQKLIATKVMTSRQRMLIKLGERTIPRYKSGILIPLSVTHLTFGRDFDQSITIPPSVTI